MRASGEHLASRDAEIRRLQQDNFRLQEQLTRANRELALTANIFTVAAPKNASARVFIDPQQRAFVVIVAPPGSYELSVIRSDQPNPQRVASIGIPSSGQKTLMLTQLPPQTAIKSFALTPR